MDRQQEVKIFLDVWASAIASLCYCYFVAGSAPKGSPRLVAMLPVFYLLVVLPLRLSSIQLGAATAFLLVWLCGFKLLLFTFGAGPLALSPSCLHFILVAASPIIIREGDTRPEQVSSGTPVFQYIGRHCPQEVVKLFLAAPVESRYWETKPVNPSSTSKSTRTRGFLHDAEEMAVLVAKVFVLVLLIHLCDYRHHLPLYVVLAIHGINIALGLELVLAMSTIPAWFILGGLAGIELDAQFDSVHLTTSLEDYWGRRWNLTVSGVLRMAVYNPMRKVCIPTMGTEIGSYAAVIATFFVSGLMHEVVHYYIKRQPTEWSALMFFLVHGVCVVTEKAIKKRFKGTIWHPKYSMVSRALTFSFLGVTSLQLTVFPLTKNRDIEEKALRECHVVMDFIKEKLDIFAWTP